MGGMRKHLLVMERDALTSAVLSECRRVCFLFGMEEPSEIAAVEQEALRLIADPTLPPRLTLEEIERGRHDMYGAARARGVDPETVKPEIDALLDSLVATIQAQRG